VVSNVPGPQFPLHCAGARLEANYPVSVITDGMGLNITVMSYDGHLDFGIVGDRDQVRDLWCMIDWLREGLAELEPAEPAEAPHAAAEGAGTAGNERASDPPPAASDPARASTESAPTSAESRATTPPR
jgi:hypothetical protein